MAPKRIREISVIAVKGGNRVVSATCDLLLAGPSGIHEVISETEPGRVARVTIEGNALTYVKRMIREKIKMGVFDELNQLKEEDETGVRTHPRTAVVATGTDHCQYCGGLGRFNDADYGGWRRCPYCNESEDE